MLELEKYKVDYSDRSLFKGIRILLDYLAEGTLYVKEKKIKDVCIWTNGDFAKKELNFDFLKDIDFIENFECLVSLSKKSNITSLYDLTKLKKFRWAVDCDLPIDFSFLGSLNSLNINYNSKLTNWSSLKNLTELYIQSVKTKDLEFMNGIKNIKQLRIINGSFISLQGLEKCEKLESIRIVNCPKLNEVLPVLSKIKGLQQITFERCKSINFNKETTIDLNYKIFIV